ncbi:MAG: ABC transporter permease [Bacteroidota bacterium]|nr:ABC transporter permease [Bacteroidota bacterium]MDP4251376.1 ABC transporter permease [Bacteroidota bacterium]
MLWNYLKIAYRSLKKNRLVSFINIFGLGLSMSVGMMEMLIVQNELGYDHFHPYSDRTYRITSAYTPKNGIPWKLASTPAPLYPSLLADTGIVQEAVNIYPAFHGEAISESKDLNIDGAFTEPAFFKIFGFSLAAGNEETALQKPNSLVISQSTAKRFFGNTNPLGKFINFQKIGLFQVTGVLNKAPGKSHIDFDAYASASSIPILEMNKLLPAKSNDWSDFGTVYTYVLLKKQADKKPLQGLLNAITSGMNKEDKGGRSSMAIQPIEKVRPASGDLNNDIGGGTTWTKLWVGIDVSLLILLAACFNYTNLTVARALTRAKEVGVRKIAGAKRYQLFVQYVVESVLLAFFALAFAWILLSLIVRYAPFNDSYEMIPSSWRYNGPYFLLSFGFAVFTGLLAGIAPAWILSSFKPLRVLKNLSTAKIFGKVSLQKTLIVFQYSLSLVIIIFLFTFYRQFSFLGAEDPGFKRDNVLVVPVAGMNEHILSQKIGMLSGVQSVTGLSTTFEGHFYGMRSPARIDNQQKDAASVNYFFTDPAFIPSMHLELLAGRNFSPVPDSGREEDIILNAQAVKGFGIKSNQLALGKKLWVNDSTALTIIGVVNDFKYENAGKPVYPMAFRNKTGALNYLFISVDPTEKDAITQRIARAWKSLSPAEPFSFSWLDQDLDKNNSQRATLSLLGYLAFIALSIATLGLLGLVVYTVETRRKEIGIRKVIGGSQQQIVGILSKGFIRLLFIAGAIAVPIGYVLSIFFLQNFVTRVGYGLFSALSCFAFLMLIGLFTIISQTYKASMENPVKSLRTE